MRSQASNQARYVNHHWAVTKFCTAAFRGPHDEGTKASANALRKAIVSGKGYDDMDKIVGDWTGEADFQEIVRAVESRNGRRPRIEDVPSPSEVIPESCAELAQPNTPQELDLTGVIKTPVNNRSPDPTLLRAPLGPANDARMEQSKSGVDSSAAPIPECVENGLGHPQFKSTPATSFITTLAACTASSGFAEPIW